jgi:methylphosphotriester-DNA--protein-cysteine methyltransferase
VLDVEKVKEFIRDNLKATLGLKEISTAFRKDPGDLDRAFRNVEGMTIKRYIDVKLKGKVEQRLADGGVKGYEVAKEFGFLSEQSFYRWSKRVFGASFFKLRRRMDKHS